MSDAELHAVLTDWLSWLVVPLVGCLVVIRLWQLYRHLARG